MTLKKETAVVLVIITGILLSPWVTRAIRARRLGVSYGSEQERMLAEQEAAMK